MKMTASKFLLLLVILFLVISGSIYIYVDSIVSEGLPSLDQLENPRQNLATQVMSSDGELLDMFSVQRRIYLPYDSIPKDFINALIAVEDRDFYNHWGINVTRVISAAVKDILAGGYKEGASTITMQLARNLFLEHRATLSRKIQEAFIAMQIERTYTKKEILELYTNTVIFGRGAYGLQVASEIYFNKQPMQLTTAQCAFLVGILKNPENYNSMLDYDRAIGRRNLVLNLMESQGYLSMDQMMKAAEEPIVLAFKKVPLHKRFMEAPHFVEMIRQQLKNKLKDKDLYRDGLIINTTLNSRIQKYANEAVEEHLSEYQKIFDRSWSWRKNKDLLNELISESIQRRADYISANKKKRKLIETKLKNNKAFIDSIKKAKTTIQCALVVINPANGSILAMVGASPIFMKNHSDAKYSLNHATQILRQPGSCFKPILYTCALEAGLTPETKISREPFTYTDPYTGEKWSPRGSAAYLKTDSITLYSALIHSVNTASARLITEYTNPGKVISMAYRMGITAHLMAVPALALGAGGEVKPIDMVSAFGTFPNKGIHVKPFAVYSVEDRHGNIIQKQRKSMEATDVFSKRIAEMMIYLMSGVVEHGTGKNVRKYFRDCDAAGKTGTTNDYADAWFIGYTPELVAGVWVGFDDRRITFTGGYGYASTAAAPLWGKLMAKIYSDNKLPYKKRHFDYSIVEGTDSTTIDMQILRNLQNVDLKKEDSSKVLQGLPKLK